MGTRGPRGLEEESVELTPDEQIIMLYEKWSEEIYAAGFMSPHPRFVEEFRGWLITRGQRNREGSETAMLEEYKRQEATPPPAAQE